MEPKRNNPTPTSSAARRIDSASSMGSMGIGAAAGAARPAGNPADTAPARLVPAGERLPPTPLYDCVVYLFYCPRHDRIALSSPERNRIIWLPFLALEGGVTWAAAAQAGIATFLGRRRASELALADQGEGAVAFVQVPPTQMQFVHLLHLQMPSSGCGRSVVRVAAFIKLLNADGSDATTTSSSIIGQGTSARNIAQPSQQNSTQNPNSFQCCQNTLYLNWQLIGDVLAEPPLIEGIWAPEVRQLLQLLITPAPIWMEEMTVDGSLRLLSDSAFTGSGSSDPKYLKGFLASCSITSETLQAVYEDYIEHLYPAVLMSAEALRAYLYKYGYPKATNNNASGKESAVVGKDFRFFTNLLSGFAYKRRPAYYIDFEEFLFGIVALEPATKNGSEVRLRLLFRFYDADGDDILNGEEVKCLVKDLNPKATTEAAISEAVTKTMAAVCGANHPKDHLTFELFSKAVTANRGLRGTGNLCRSPKAVIPQILNSAKSRTMALNAEADLTSTGSNSKPRKPKKTGRGVCMGCRAHDVDFCLHTVHLDSAAMCQKPLQIKEVNFTNESAMTPMRYSAEVVFSIGSLFRAFTDSIRDGAKESALGNPSATSGLMAGGQAEAEMMASHVGCLVEQVSELLASEERLIRVNSPAVIVGDLAGSLSSLLALEKTFWPSMPVVTNSLLFTGNYVSGGSNSTGRSNVEVLCYLLAFKAMAPNRVFLLRGANETREGNRKSLLEECTRKYGLEVGKVIWGRLNEALDRLPFAAIVDESILAIHSGIPRAAASAGGSLLSKCFELHKSIGNVQRESPLAYELISNVPTDVEQSTSERAVEGGNRTPPLPPQPHMSPEKGHHRAGRKVSPNSTAASSVATSAGTNTFNWTHFAAFLKANHLTHVIRGHDQPPTGYRFHFEGRCITISAANPAAVVVATVDGSSETIRLVKVLLEQGQQQHKEKDHQRQADPQASQADG